MHVIAFNGSPRPNGNTFTLIRHCLDTIEAEGITTELIQVGRSGIHPCLGCNSCRKRGVEECVITDDPLNEWFAKIVKADGIILGTPTYCWGPTPTMKCLVDRVTYLSRCKLRGGELRNPLYHKVGAAIAVDAYSGSPMAVQALQTLFFVTQMIVPGANYWPVGKGLDIGDVEKDVNGMGYVADLGRNMAWLLRKINA